MIFSLCEIIGKRNCDWVEQKFKLYYSNKVGEVAKKKLYGLLPTLAKLTSFYLLYI